MAKGAVVALGGGFMISPEAKAAGKDGGYRGWQLYMAGRGGVLGADAPAEVVSAAMGFFSPEMVRVNWEAGRAIRPVPDTVERYAEACRDWGRHRFGGLDGLDRLCALLSAVVERADPAGLPLYAGWRAVPLPDDAPGRASQLLHVLREHRGGAHLLAVLASGLTPQEAVVAGPYGPAEATFHGWAEPHPEPDAGIRERHARAEQLTDELVAPAYEALREDEVEELARLLSRAGDQARAGDQDRQAG
ncbi:MAG: SCO6745 family protein [Kineosporiaceae bacterium]